MIHVVNLKSRPDRLSWVQEELCEQPQNMIKIWEASTPDNITIFDTPNFYDPYSDQFIRAGEMACCLSHMRIIKEIADGPDPYGIVCEDDICLKDKKTQLLDVAARVWNDKPFDLLYLSRQARDFENEQEVGTVELNGGRTVSSLRTAGYSYWTLAYVISKKAAIELHQAWIKSSFTLIPIDEIYPLMCGHGPDRLKKDYPSFVNQWVAYALFPTLAQPRETLSDTYSSPPMGTLADEAFQVISVATEENDMTLRLRDTCTMYNLPVHITGIGTPWNGGDLSAGPGGAHKIILLRQYMVEKYQCNSNSNSDSIVVFVDGYDVVANLSKRELLESYHKHYDGQVVFAAERSCWPDKALIKEYPSPPHESQPRYLNSGVFMGPVRLILDILNDPELMECVPGDDDQLLYTHMFLSKRYPMVLDYEQHVFQCLSMESKLVNLHHLRPWLQFEGRRPAFVHGNGGVVDKCWFERLQSYSSIGWNPTYGDYRNVTHPAPTTIFGALFVDRDTYPNEYMQRLLEVDRQPDEWRIYVMSEFMERAKSMRKQLVEEMTTTKEIRVVECKEHKDLLAMACVDFQNTPYSYLLVYGSSVIPTVDSVRRLEQDLNAVTWRSIVAPVLQKGKQNFANFWGGLSSTQWYQSSADYFEILGGKRRGCFPVPQVSEMVMMKRRAAIPAYALDGYETHIGSWITYCRNARKNNHTIWVDNRSQLEDGKEVWSFDSPLYANYSTLYEEPGQFLAEGGYSTPILWQRNYLVKSPDQLFFEEVEMDGWKHSGVWYGPLVTEKFCKEIRAAANRDPSRWKHVEDGQIDVRTGGKEHARTHDVHLKDIPYYPLAEDQSPSEVKQREQKQYMQRCIDYLMDAVIIPWSWDTLKFQLKRARLSFVVKYSMDVQRSLKWHHDASAISVDIALNNAGPGEDEFEGGGVSYDRMNYSMQHGKMGYVALHPGRVTHRHRGNPITRGIREILVMFTE